MEATLNPPPKPKESWRKLIEKMTSISTDSYRHNINDNSDFNKVLNWRVSNKLRVLPLNTMVLWLALNKLKLPSR